MRIHRHKILALRDVVAYADKAIQTAFDNLVLVRVVPPVRRKFKKLLRRSWNTQYDGCTPALTKAQKQRLWLDFWWNNPTRQSQFGCLDQMLAIEDKDLMSKLLNSADVELRDMFVETLR